jgi:hypothetical protein
LLTSEFDLILKEYKRIFEQRVMLMYNEIVNDSPVDKGRFKQNWKIDELDEDNFRFKASNNTKDYGSILWAGYMVIDGKAYGSIKGWGATGGEPIVQKHLELLAQEFERI